MTRRTTRALVVATALAAATAALSACSGGQPTARPTTTKQTPAVAPAPPAAPPKRACYDLDFAAAARATSAAAPVPCSAPHTTVTLQVGTIRPVRDGHLLAVDSDTVQQQIASRCRARLATEVGGDEEARRLSRLAVVWFSPSLAESDQGALWFRCDLVALAGHDRLAALPRSTRNLLASDGALDRFGTCGTSAPGGPHFQRVICSARHSWRARATLELTAGARYLSKRAGAVADAACHDIDARVASDVLKLRWSFEWPTRAEWDSGQRYGYCWTPDPA